MLGRSELDRSTHERDDELVARLLADPQTAILDLWNGQAEVSDGTLALRAPRAHEDPEDPLWIFLGRDRDGRGYLARVVDTEPGEGGAWATLREVGHRLDDRDAGAFTTALGLANWHLRHPCCSLCGAATKARQAGWLRRCVADGSEHYPRTDPAIIVAVIDADDRLLLGHNAMWPRGRFSTLAGFVEPGESLEDGVRREVAEEAGVVVGDVHFLASQPWPFPASLMLGCVAHADDPTIRVDGEELTEARWFTRDELAREVEAGLVVPPGGVSIARRLVEYWFGGPLPDGPHRW